MLLAVLITALPVSGLAGEEQKVLRVAFPQTDGFSETGEDGQRYGLVVDYLNEIAKYTGWTYEYVDTDSADLISDFFEGKFDLMGGTYYSEGFEAYFAYPDYNCGYSKLLLLSRRDDDSIKSYDLDTLNGKTIGVYEKATENIRRLKAYLSVNNLECTLKYYSYEQIAAAKNLNRFLDSGEVDLTMGNSSDAGKDYAVAVSMDSQPHFIVTTPGNREVQEGLNMALEKIYDADPYFAKSVYAKHFPEIDNKFIQLNEQERKYISSRGPVTVAVPRDWHPMFCIGSGALHSGLVPDMLQVISEYSGLEFSYVPCDNYGEAVRKVQAGEADLLGFFLDSEEDAVRRNLALTASYVQLDTTMVRNKYSGYPAEGLKGAMLEGRDMPGNIVADEVKYYFDAAEALADVNRGSVDFIYGVSSHLEYLIQQNNFTNVVQVNQANGRVGVGFALSAPADPELLTIINKAINNMTEKQRTAVSGRNVISIGTSRMTLSNIVYANPMLTLAVVAAFLILVMIGVVFFAGIRLRTMKIQHELEKAEADSHAKSEFLSRMSHEIRTPMNAIVGLTDLTEMIDGMPEKASENLARIRSSSRYLLSLISDILDMSRIQSDKMKIASEPFSMGAMLGEIESMFRAEADNKEIRFAMEQKIQDDELAGDVIRLRQVITNLLSNAFKFTPRKGSVLVYVEQIASTDNGAVFSIRVIDDGVGIGKGDQQRIFQSFEQAGTNASRSQGTGLGLAISCSIVCLMGGKLELRSELGKGSEFYFTITLPKSELSGQADRPRTLAGRMLRGMNILLAEDYELNAEIVTELLEMQGAKVSRAENGKEALELFERSSPGEFDIILMDVLMPVMNGLEAAREIRSLQRPDAKTVPIIAATANAFREDEEAALEAGMTGFIPKPIDVVQLYDALCAAIKSGNAEGGTQDAAEDGTQNAAKDATQDGTQGVAKDATQDTTQGVAEDAAKDAT